MDDTFPHLHLVNQIGLVAQLAGGEQFDGHGAVAALLDQACPFVAAQVDGFARVVLVGDLDHNGLAGSRSGGIIFAPIRAGGA
ncbi:hypothetical protein SDC9_88246 [bioreactor metagenome]|uniref:Uncharacterized protein n=1 Tax=bioreactor metagenome TaxID=1076179 RepID=A0A644ZP25_9ZZZZ